MDRLQPMKHFTVIGWSYSELNHVISAKKHLKNFSHYQSDTMQAISVSYHPEAVFVSSRNARSLRTTA